MNDAHIIKSRHYWKTQFSIASHHTDIFPASENM